MNAVSPVSVFRRIEKTVSERIMSLRKLHGQFVVATAQALQHEFNNDELIPVRARTAARRLDQFQP